MNVAPYAVLTRANRQPLAAVRGSCPKKAGQGASYVKKRCSSREFWYREKVGRAIDIDQLAWMRYEKTEEMDTEGYTLEDNAGGSGELGGMALAFKEPGEEWKSL